IKLKLLKMVDCQGKWILARPLTRARPFVARSCRLLWEEGIRGSDFRGRTIEFGFFQAHSKLSDMLSDPLVLFLGISSLPDFSRELDLIAENRRHQIITRVLIPRDKPSEPEFRPRTPIPHLMLFRMLPYWIFRRLLFRGVFRHVF